MPSYKLTYFPVKGRAEPTRMMFAIAGVEFEDKRIAGDDWKSIKPTIPLGQMPILEVDGRLMYQSNAIHRFVAAELGFYGPTAWDRAQVDMIIETGRELTPQISQVFTEKDETKKAELRKQFETEHAEKNLSNLEKLLKLNNGGSGWFVGDKLSLADIIAFNLYYDFLPFVCGKKMGELDFAGHETFKGFIERFKAHPKISEYLKNRPVTAM